MMKIDAAGIINIARSLTPYGYRIILDGIPLIGPRDKSDDDGSCCGDRITIRYRDRDDCEWVATRTYGKTRWDVHYEAGAFRSVGSIDTGRDVLMLIKAWTGAIKASDAIKRSAEKEASS